MTANAKNWKVLPQDYQISLGSYNGVYQVNKFGANPVVGTSEEDVWSTGGKETLLTTGTTLYASCTDNSNGVGQTIRVFGLDANWEQSFADVVLTGNTQAEIPGTWTRVHRVFQVSAEPDPVGDVYIAELDAGIVGGIPQTASLIHAFVDYTDAPQITEKCMYTIPAGKCGLLRRFHAEMGDITSGSARSAEVFIEAQFLADGATVASPSWSPWRRVIGHVVATTNNSDTATLDFPIVFPELTNVHARATATANSKVEAEFTLIIVDMPQGNFSTVPQQI